ncbi:MAG: hypothetical protein H6621_12395 [Halobacteriovoraceae bacterium]|nr:hypothetical protein [Halobacteriovoraceae bacterium]
MKILLVMMTWMVLGKLWAVPILSDSEAHKYPGGVILYPDHADSEKFYFFPNSSKMARDRTNLPIFGFTYWGLGSAQADGGAYLTLTTQLTSSIDQNNALEKFLRDHPGSEIAMLPVQKSTISLTSTKDDGKPLGLLFDEWNFSEFGGQGDAEIGVNAILTKTGAKVFKAAIKNPGLLNFFYCYDVMGWTADFDAVIDINWKRVYDYYRASLSGGHWFRKISITREVEKLKQQNFVRIQVNGGSASDKDYVNAIAEKIIKRLFVVELQAKPLMGGGRGGAILNFSFASVHREELKQEKWVLTRRQATTLNQCLPVSLQDIRNHYSEVVRDADL